MVPLETTVANVEHELPAMVAYAERHNWRVNWLPDTLAVVADGKHPADSQAVRIEADVTGYRAQPPAWAIGALGENSQLGAFPLGAPLPNRKSSIFHGNGVICAPFNRLAYKDNGGPHNDWGGPMKWLTVRGKVTAFTLGEMLAVIVSHLKYSPGWKK